MTINKIAVWNGLADEMLLNDLHEEALYYLNRIMGVDPLNHDAVENKAYILEILDRYEEAIECVSSYLKHNPFDAIVWIINGDLLDVNYNDYKGAVDCFNWALTIDPKNEEAWTKKAYALKEMGLYAEAAECFREVMRLMDASPTISGYTMWWQEHGRDLYCEYFEEYKDCLKLMGD